MIYPFNWFFVDGEIIIKNTEEEMNKIEKKLQLNAIGDVPNNGSRYSLHTKNLSNIEFAQIVRESSYVRQFNVGKIFISG